MIFHFQIMHLSILNMEMNRARELTFQNFMLSCFLKHYQS